LDAELEDNELESEERLDDWLDEESELIEECESLLEPLADELLAEEPLELRLDVLESERLLDDSLLEDELTELLDEELSELLEDEEELSLELELLDPLSLELLELELLPSQHLQPMVR
jgi:hypothetical protein